MSEDHKSWVSRYPTGSSSPGAVRPLQHSGKQVGESAESAADAEDAPPDGIEEIEHFLGQAA